MSFLFIRAFAQILHEFRCKTLIINENVRLIYFKIPFFCFLFIAWLFLTVMFEIRLKMSNDEAWITIKSFSNDVSCTKSCTNEYEKRDKLHTGNYLFSSRYFPMSNPFILNFIFLWNIEIKYHYIVWWNHFKQRTGIYILL